MQWLGPLAGSVLTLTGASRVILDLTHQGLDLSPELRFSFRSWGRPHPQLCLVGRGRNRCAASLLPRRLPCRYLQRRPPRPHRARAGASRARPTFVVVPTEADSVFPSSGRGSTEAAALPSPDPLRHSRPCAALRFTSLFGPSLSPSAGPRPPVPGCQGNPSDARRGRALGGRRRQCWARGAPGAADHGAPE